MTFAVQINQALGGFTVFEEIFIVVLLAFSFTRRGREWVRHIVGEQALFYGFIVALAATLGSLIYSDVLGYEPCKLCWFQRIFMYPQVLLLGFALIKKQRVIIDYALALAIPGALVAGYHYLLQLGVAPSLPCAAVGYSVSCSERFVLQFGYITIPLMAFTAFVLIGFLLWYGRAKK